MTRLTPATTGPPLPPPGRRARPGHIRRRTLAALAFLAFLIAAPHHTPAQRTASEPEAPTGNEAKSLATAQRFMVSAANPHAVEAGLEILRAGGSAVDAAIAVQLVLNIVEPQSSGLGGGAFIVHFAAAPGTITTFDGRETAPAAARPERFLKADGTQRQLKDAIQGGLSVGVPGLVRVMAQAHARHGKLPWARLFEPAIRLAEQGFPVSRRLSLLLRLQGQAAFSPEARAYFFPGGRVLGIGQHLQSPALAQTLRELAEQGPDAFYAGRIAASIVRAVREAPRHKGDLTPADLAGYRAVERPPVCVTYRAHRVCGMGPPSSGGLTVAQVLALLEGFTLDPIPLDGDGVHLLIEAQKLAYADRDLYMADPDFVPVPAAGLLDPDYMARRRKLIDPHRTRGKAAPGRPPGVDARHFGPDATRESPGTSHISIVDDAGNAVAMTTTIESAFGSGLMAAGFLLNNQLTDFSLSPRDASGRLAANAVAGGKRPRSSMAPTIVLKDGKLDAVLGSPGGSRIILYVLKSIVALIDWKQDAQGAASLVNFGSRNGPFEIEFGLEGPVLGLKMGARGHSVSPQLMTSGLHIITVRGGRLEGGADPRREGIAKGD